MIRVVMLLLFFVCQGAVFSQSGNLKKVYYSSDPNRTGIVKYKFPNSAPRRFEDLKNITVPEINDLRLKFPSNSASAYLGPDGGDVYIWQKDQYQWKRSDKSVFTEWPNGAWKLEQPEGTVINSFLRCAGCPPEAQIVFKDGSELLKNWVPHRKEYDWIFQKDNTAPALNWKLVDPSKVQPGKAQLSKYTFYYSPEWDSFIAALKKRFPGDIFFDYLRKEFGLENAGQIPVILFDNEKSLTAYAGRELPHGGSSGGGFGGRDSIIMDHYDAEKPLTGDPLLDDYTLRMVNFRTLFHESVHNLEQMTCLTERIGKKNLKNYAADPWFDEGIANFAIQDFVPNLKAEVYSGLDELIKNGKVPSSYSGLINKKYDDLLPYRLGAYMIEYLYKSYGKEKFIQFNREICLGGTSADALKKTHGISGDQLLSSAVSDFKSRRSSLMANLDKLRYKGYTVMTPKNQKEFSLFLKKPPVFPSKLSDIKDYDDIASLASLRANVEPYLNKMSGFFDGPGESVFYLYPNGNYYWSADDWKVFYHPDTKAFSFTRKGWTAFEWENGQKKIVAPDQSSLVFWNRNQKGFFDSSGKQIK